MTTRHDISTLDDITTLVDEFYHRAFKNEMLAPHFIGLDFNAHKPRMIAFWAFVLLDQPGYTTNVFDKHTHLHIGPEHFTEWVNLFHQTVDDLFEGDKANDAKLRASSIGWSFGEKMKNRPQA